MYLLPAKLAVILSASCGEDQLERETIWQSIPHAEISFPYGTTL